MRGTIRLIVVAVGALALQGCLAKTVVDVATLPVKAAGQTVDWATTSQDEADRNRGRELRRSEERYDKLQREYEKQNRKCQAGDDHACAKAHAAWDEMESLRSTPPPGRP